LETRPGNQKQPATDAVGADPTGHGAHCEGTPRCPLRGRPADGEQREEHDAEAGQPPRQGLRPGAQPPNNGDTVRAARIGELGHVSTGQA
jgi:hypothetical protein